MKPRPTRRRPASSPPRWAVALALCSLGLAACNGPERPPDAALGRIAPVEREVTLRIEPQAGRIEALQARAVLTRIANDLALDFEVADLAQAGDQTSFRLVVRNRGSALSELKVRLSGDRARPSGADTLQLGALGENGETSAELRFDNPGGQAFIVTLNLWAMLAANGAAAPAGSAAPGAGSPPSPLPSGPEAPASSAPSASPTGAPSAAPSPNGLPTAAPTPLAPPLDNPGPNAARGRVLLNGQGAAGIKLSLIRNPGWAQRTVVTGADGSFTAKDLEPGDYLLYYYNDSDRNKIGYWRSRSQRLDATTGAAFPVVDFYQLGLKNLPAMDTHRTLPVTFEWVPQTQTVDYYRFRLHSTGGRSFTLIHQSDKLPGNSNRFTWDGAGTTLDPRNRYFWGVFWDAGALGEGGNLYQAIYLSR